MQAPRAETPFHLVEREPAGESGSNPTPVKPANLFPAPAADRLRSLLGAVDACLPGPNDARVSRQVKERPRQIQQQHELQKKQRQGSSSQQALSSPSFASFIRFSGKMKIAILPG